MCIVSIVKTRNQFPCVSTHLFASISFPNRSKLLLCCFQRLETNEDVFPSDYDPSTPSSNLPKRISYLRKTNILQRSTHVSFKPFASLRSPRLVIYETISRIQPSKPILYHFGLEPHLKAAASDGSSHRSPKRDHSSTTLHKSSTHCGPDIVTTISSLITVPPFSYFYHHGSTSS